MIGYRDGDVGLEQSVTIVVTRTVKPGYEAAYEEWLHGVGEVAHSYPGHLGLTVIRPRPGSRDYTIVFRFDTAENLQRWEQSDERRAWLARIEGMVEGDDVQKLTGMETWFTLPGGGAVTPPPRWKMVIVTFSVAFPIIQVLTATLAEWLSPLPRLVRGAFVGLAMVLLMTYAAMPLATRLFRKWLYPGKG